ncbi:CatB-related O-acetyltransferase [Pseudenterobacter timonensis]|uniref:CatB-related O-acetyltransferase n=1 Tax=Pseudenterobacter timonensis TaxID=1755099 RepID=A0ABV4A4D8_9ENTR
MIRFIKKNKKIYELIRGGYTFLLKIRYRAKNIDIRARILQPLHLSQDFVLGRYSFINKGCFIGPRVHCGNYVMFGPYVIIAGGDHDFTTVGQPMYFSGRQDIPTTKIGHDVWIGAHSCIKAGVNIGDGAIIGMGSVVVRDVPPFAIVAGNPAKFIRMRFNEHQISQHMNNISNDDKVVRNYCE